MNNTSYDDVLYPSSIFSQTHPDRLATLSRLHGLNPPDPATARVLEIGGGDGLNLIALGVACPQAQFLSFDLAAVPVGRGRDMVEDLGITNVQVEVGDILDAAMTMEGQYDYVIAHGVYAWVPEVVRTGIMQLIGRVLSSDGVAFISYNALPGGQMRAAIRHMLLRRFGHIDDPEEKVTHARIWLAQYGEPRDDEPVALQGLRHTARDMLEKKPAVLFHDELGPCFFPQAVSDVAAAAEIHGLQYLTDAGRGLLGAAFVMTPDADTATPAIVSSVQDSDDEEIRFFRQSLFVRGDVQPSRYVDPERIRGLYASIQGAQVSPGRFSGKAGSFGISDERLVAALATLEAATPRRLKVGEVTTDDDVAVALFRLFEAGLTELHVMPLPASDMNKVDDPAWRPRLNRLAALQVRDNYGQICTLDHRVFDLDDPAARSFVATLDGSRTLGELENVWTATEYAAETPFEDALAMVIKAALVE